MARPLSHTPAPPDDESAHQELDELLAALADSGLLRALTGAIRAHPEIVGLVAKRIEPDDAEAVAVVATQVSVPSPDGARRLVAGLRRARAAADRALATATPPSLLDLVRLARHDDVRRGLAAVLAALGGLAAGLAQSDGEPAPGAASSTSATVGPR
jgi:uncharacterized protein YjgD (DUF1641 family)